jgi:hypothetical protein
LSRDLLDGIIGVDVFATAEQVQKAIADGRAFFHYVHTHKEIDMTTSKPMELGKVSEQTKHFGPGPSDNGVTPVGPINA